jgi:hypothetical protein
MEYIVEVGGAGLHVRAPADSNLPIGSSTGLRMTMDGIRTWGGSTPAATPQASVS